MYNLSRPIRITFFIIGAVVIFIFGYIVFLLVKNNSANIPFLRNKETIEQASGDKYVVKKDDGSFEYKKDFAKTAKDLTIEEITSSGSELAEYSGIITTETKKEFDKEVLKGAEPNNNFIYYKKDGKLSLNAIFINQADYVTIFNESDSPATLSKKVNDKKIEVPIPAGERITIGFDFLGTHNYSINSQEFKVVVEKR